MKYYTKEWYSLCQKLDYTLCMEPIADKNYTDEEIATMYDKGLKDSIEESRREYDEPPFFVDIDFDDCQLDDFCFFDEESGTLKHAQSMEEVKKNMQEERERAQREFDNRPPFDPTEAEEFFKNRYDGGIKYGYMRYPDWVKDEVDVRLIALGYLPKSVFDRLKVEEKQNKAQFDKICRNAKKALQKESKNIPQRILRDFGFHDGTVLSFAHIGTDVVLTVRADGVPFEDETLFSRVIFKDGKILRHDKELTLKKDGARFATQWTWLYEELYKTAEGYEAHAMLVDDGLGYFTVSCSDILIEKNINI